MNLLLQFLHGPTLSLELVVVVSIFIAISPDCLARLFWISIPLLFCCSSTTRIFACTTPLVSPSVYVEFKDVGRDNRVSVFAIANSIYRLIRAVAAKHIDSLSHCFEMLGIATSVVATKVVNISIGWNFSIGEDICYPMSVKCRPTETDCSISVSPQGTQPIPASVWLGQPIYFAPKSLNLFLGNRGQGLTMVRHANRLLSRLIGVSRPGALQRCRVTLRSCKYTKFRDFMGFSTLAEAAA